MSTCSSSTSSNTTSSATTAVAAVPDALCGICYTLIDAVDNPRGRLNSCEHLFCAYCIKQWAKSTNVCPLCKARFTRIYTQLPGTHTVEETKVRRRNYKDWQDDDDDDDDEASDDGEGREDDEHAGGDDDGDDNDDDERRRVRRRRRQRRARDGDVTPTVRCAVCHGSSNASRMIFCDRRVCTYAAHLDCIGYRERPLTFLCPACTARRQSNNSNSSSSSSDMRSEEDDNNSSSSSFAGRGSAATPSRAPCAPLVVGRKMPMRGDSAVAAWARRHRVVPPLPSQHSAEGDDVNDGARASSPRQATPARRDGDCSTRGDDDDNGDDGSVTRSHNVVDDTATVVDFARCNLPPPTTRRVRHASAATARHDKQYKHDSNNNNHDGDDTYFLQPTAHAQQAWQQLVQQQATRAYEAQQQRARLEARARRLGVALAADTRTTATTLPQRTMHAAGAMGGSSSLRRPRQRPRSLSHGAADGDAAQQPQQLASLTEEEEQQSVYDDATARRALEERLTREWAAELLPILRRNDDIATQRLRIDANNRVVAAAPPSAAQERAREQALWQQAMQQARVQVRAKMDATALQLRRRREHLVHMRAVREAAALAKLARVIALHRQQQRQQEAQSS